jgi:hypothetical protein
MFSFFVFVGWCFHVLTWGGFCSLIFVMDNYDVELREAVKALEERRLDKKTPESLRTGLQALQMNYMNQGPTPGVKAAIESFENEISRRVQLDQGKNLHGETMGELTKIKISVDQLARARCVDKWILVAGWIAAVGAAVAAWFALFPKR